MSEILTPFPAPPGAVLHALQLLDVLRRGDEDEMAKYGADLRSTPRPWEPSTCPRDLREAIWLWCDGVVEWINYEYIWRSAQTIPACWLHHRHIARELPLLAVQRWRADTSTGLDATDEWHRYALPMFLDRLRDRIGEGACMSGKHDGWPAEPRAAAYSDAAAVDARQTVIHHDAHPVVTQLRAAERAR